MRSDSQRGPHGGARPGAGRKPKKYRLDAPHRTREKFSTPSPVHVTMRGREYIFELRNDLVYELLSNVLERYHGDRFDRGAFRVIHFSIQDNHLHMIVEAASDAALVRGMRSFAINSARAINASIGARGKVWFRFHSTLIKTRRYARNSIAYVLGNWRRHRKDFNNGRFVSAKIDPFSSAICFTGWNRQFKVPPGYKPLPVSPAATSLLRTGWAFAGPLDPYQAPGPIR